MFNFRDIPPVVKNLLIINGLMYVAMIALQSQGIDLTSYFGLHYWKSEGFYPHQLITYIFCLICSLYGCLEECLKAFGVVNVF